MDNVVPFPSEEVRSWASWCQFVHKVVSGAGKPPAVADHVLAKIRPLFDALGDRDPVSVFVCGECVTAVQDLDQRLDVAAAERNRRILMERLKREFELYVRHGFV